MFGARGSSNAGNGGANSAQGRGGWEYKASNCDDHEDSLTYTQNQILKAFQRCHLEEERESLGEVK